MQITRTEPDTGGPSRTPRQEMAPLITGKREVNPEAYVDCSPSEGWPWRSNPAVNTWSVQIPSLKGFTQPFAMMDSQAANELAAAISAGGAEEAGGVELWPFSDRYLPLSDKKDAEGDLIIDANPGNFDERWAYFVRLYSKFFDKNGVPEYGGTKIMEAVNAGDAHFISEFGDRALEDRPLRLRTGWSDGIFQDKSAFITYLSQATPVKDPRVSETTVIGRHGKWDEIWLIGVFGEEGGGGHEAYQELVILAKDHPWIYPLYFENVISADEATEDMALMGVPVQA